ncbi:MAG: hypothetical protein IJ220_09095 [Clostridia bacterium]|nr:hypothetical protein [Clostridia bacterium]
MKRCVAIVLVAAMLLSSFCIAAPLPKKKETVYVNLDSYGKVNKINIYSKWITNGVVKLEDRTKYISLNNLTNRESFLVSGDTTIWNTSGEKYFTYTGEVGEEYYDLIPWTFDISYKVNGVEATADELLGAKGLIKITIDIENNEKTNSYYKNNYMLEITGTYDMSEYLSVESEDAMITDTGNSKTLMFIVLPGQSTTLNIEIGSNDFSMDGITMALVPITGDIRDQIVELIENKEDIEEAIDAIDVSANIALNAMEGMTTGLNGVSNGVKEIKQGTKNIHGLNELRDEDIENLNSLLNELLPLMNQMQRDIDNLDDTYDIIVELDDEFNSEVKNLSTNVSMLNNDLDELSKIMKNLPGDVVEINELLKATERVVNSSNTLIKKLSGTSSDSAESLSKDLNAIANETATIGALVQQTVPVTSDPETVNSLLKIGNSANNIGTNLKSVQSTLTEMSDSSLNGTKTLQNNLNKLAEELHEVSEMIEKKDAQKIVNLTNSLKETSKTLEKMLNTVTSYNDKLLNNKNDFKDAMTTIRQLVDELEKMDTLCISMTTNIQNMLNIISDDIYHGTNDTLDALISVNNQLVQMTSQSSQIKKSKDDVKDILDSKMDEIEDKTTLFNLEKDAKVVSFGSNENEYVDSVQFVLKTPDIKNVRVNNDDLETLQDSKTFWEKVSDIFEKIINWIIGIFK